MPIVYNAPTNTITVTGYTEGVPCTFLDIFNADVGGGWGVVTNHNALDIQFQFDCILQIGNGVIATWVIDTNKQVVFAKPGAGNDIIVTNNGTFRIGTLVDDTKKTSKDGCSLIKTAPSGYLFNSLGGGAKIELYSSHVINTVGRTYCMAAGTQKTYNSHFINWKVISNWATLFTAYNIVIENSESSLENTTSDAIIYSMGNQYGVTFSLGTNAQTGNLVIRGATTASVYIWAITGQPSLTDIDVDVWTFNWAGGVSTGAVTRKYTFNLVVTDDSGNIIGGATVKLYRNDGTLVFTAITDAVGTIAEQTVSRGYYTSPTLNVLQDYGPFRLEITPPSGLQMPYTHDGIILDEPVDWRIALPPSPAIKTVQVGFPEKAPVPPEFVRNVEKLIRSRSKAKT